MQISCTVTYNFSHFPYDGCNVLNNVIVDEMEAEERVKTRVNSEWEKNDNPTPQFGIMHH